MNGKISKIITSYLTHSNCCCEYKSSTELTVLSPGPQRIEQRSTAILSLQMTRESAPLAGVTLAGQSHVLF